MWCWRLIRVFLSVYTISRWVKRRLWHVPSLLWLTLLGHRHRRQTICLPLATKFDNAALPCVCESRLPINVWQSDSEKSATSIQTKAYSGIQKFVCNTPIICYRLMPNKQAPVFAQSTTWKRCYCHSCWYWFFDHGRWMKLTVVMHAIIT